MRTFIELLRVSVFDSKHKLLEKKFSSINIEVYGYRYHRKSLLFTRIEF